MPNDANRAYDACEPYDANVSYVGDWSYSLAEAGPAEASAGLAGSRSTLSDGSWTTGVWRKPSALTIAVAMALAITMVGGVLFAIHIGGSSGENPDRTVVAYLHALAEVHADKALALSVGDDQQDRTFLSDGVLARQQRKAKISHLQVVAVSTGTLHSRVSMSYRFGRRTTTETFGLTKINGAWKLDSVASTIPTSIVKTIPGLTLFDIAVHSDTVVVFPGPLTWSSTAPYFVVTDSYADQFSMSPTDYGYIGLSADLSPAGQAAVRTALSVAIARCTEITTARSDHCPQEVDVPDAVADSFVWTVVGSATDNMSYHVDSYHWQLINLLGYIGMKVTYQVRNIAHTVRTKTATVNAYLSQARCLVAGAGITVTFD